MSFAQLQCQINRLAPYIPTASPVPDGLSDLVYEDVMVRSAYTIAVWANQQSVFIPLAKYQSWQNMLRFIADPSATALATYAPDLAGIFYLAPAQFPWYALGFLGLAAPLRCWPLLLASVTLPTYYLFFPLWESDDADTFQYGVAFLHALPVWCWLAWRYAHRASSAGKATAA